MLRRIAMAALASLSLAVVFPKAARSTQGQSFEEPGCDAGAAISVGGLDIHDVEPTWEQNHTLAVYRCDTKYRNRLLGMYAGSELKFDLESIDWRPADFVPAPDSIHEPFPSGILAKYPPAVNHGAAYPNTEKWQIVVERAGRAWGKLPFHCVVRAPGSAATFLVNDDVYGDNVGGFTVRVHFSP